MLRGSAVACFIHVRHGEEYREEGESRAFPEWRAEEIHLALTESPLSETAWRALERVALSMGAREGTKSEDDALMGSHSAKVRTEGHVQGATPRGLVQGRSGMLAANVLTVRKARGIAVASDLTELRELFGTSSSDAVMAPALTCTDAADFRRRAGEQRATRGRPGLDAPRGGDRP